MNKKAEKPIVSTSVNFTELSIPFSEDNHASVFFAHLQSVFIEICQEVGSSLKIGKMDHILHDIYSEHKKLEEDFKTVSAGVKNMMVEFHKMLEDCKNDKEELMKATEDKQNLLNKLK